MNADEKEIISPAKGALLIWLVGMIAIFANFLPIISVPLLVLAWLMSFGAAFVFPTIYFLTARFGSRLHNYPYYVAAGVLLIVGLNGWYLSNAWAYGLKWQGATYTYVVSILSVIYLAAVFICAVIGIRQRSIRASQVAHLGLFVVLSFGAFPILGELP